MRGASIPPVRSTYFSQTSTDKPKPPNGSVSSLLNGLPQTPRPLDESVFDPAPDEPADQQALTSDQTVHLDQRGPFVPHTVSLHDDPQAVTQGPHEPMAQNALPPLGSVVPPAKPLVMPAPPLQIGVRGPLQHPGMPFRPVGVPDLHGSRGSRGLPPHPESLRSATNPLQQEIGRRAKALLELNPWLFLAPNTHAVISNGIDMLEDAKALGLPTPAVIGLHQQLKDKLTAAVFNNSLSNQDLENFSRLIQRFNTVSARLHNEHGNPLHFPPIPPELLTRACEVFNARVPSTTINPNKRTPDDSMLPPGKRPSVERPVSNDDVVVLRSTPAATHAQPAGASAVTPTTSRKVKSLRVQLHIELSERGKVEEALNALTTFLAQNNMAPSQSDQELIARARTVIGRPPEKSNDTGHQ